MRSKSASVCSSPGCTNTLLDEELLFEEPLLPEALLLDELLPVDEVPLEPPALLEELALEETLLLEDELPPAPDINEDELDEDTPESKPDPSDVPEL